MKPSPMPSFLSPLPTVVLPTTNLMSRSSASAAASSNYQLIFDSALEAYKKKTKKDIRSHPLFAKLQACHSPDAILTVLREQIPTFDQSSGTSNASNRLTNWLIPTVNVLNSFSSLVGSGVSLVSIRGLQVGLLNI